MKILGSSKHSLGLILALTALTAAACAPAAPADGGTDTGVVSDTGPTPTDGSVIDTGPIDSGVIPADVVPLDVAPNAEASTPAQDAAANNG